MTLPTELTSNPYLMPGHQLAKKQQQRTGCWHLEDLSGRLVELSTDHGGAPLSAALGLVREGQRQQLACAWVFTHEAVFYPPDVKATGVKLEALPILRLDSAEEAARAAEKLLRSAAFSLVVIDLGRRWHIPMPLLSRLGKLASRHRTAVLFLTEKADQVAAIGPLISLRCTSSLAHPEPGLYRMRLVALRDKHHAPGWTHEELLRGPVGLL